MTVRRTDASVSGAVELGCSRLTFEELLLKLRFGDLDFHSLIYLLGMSALVIGVVFDSSRKESIDEGRLSQTRFASNLKDVTF